MTARWVWIIRDNADFGMTFECATRINEGEIYGRDFFCVVPPLAFYTEALFIRLLHGSIWSHQLHLFFWWYLALLVGFLAAKRLTSNSDILAAGSVLAVIISSPTGTNGQSYNYAATTLCGLSMYLHVWSKRRHSNLPVQICTGMALGLAIITKQNIGIFFLAFLVSFLVAEFALASTRHKLALVRNTIGMLLGVAVGFGIPFLLLASKSSIRGLYDRIFVDGVALKGGLPTIAVRAIPRFALSDLVHTPYYRLSQGVVSVIFIAVLFAFGTIRLSRLRTESDQPVAKSGRISLSVWLVLAAIATLSLLSLSEIPSISLIGERLAALCLSASIGFGLVSGQLWYFICTVAFGLICAILVRSVFRQYRADRLVSEEIEIELFVYLGAVVVSIATVLSGIMYFPYAAPLALPIVAVGLHRYFRLSFGSLNLVTIVATALFYVWPSHTKTFTRYVALPTGSPFGGLYSSKERADRVDQIWREIRPLIQGKTTLWLAIANPYQAFGGRLVPNVIPMDCNPPWIQQTLMERWNQSLPERVILEPVFLDPANNAPSSLQFSEKWLFGWLDANFIKIYDERGLAVWSKKAL